MKENWVFDAKPSQEINEARLAALSAFLPDLVSQRKFENALDAGCGIGVFSRYLSKIGLRTTSFDVRAENVAEARTREPNVEFHVCDIEETGVLELGTFDLVLCFGLLYHLESPFRAIRNLQNLTRSLLLIESMVMPEQKPVAALVNEAPGMDQSLRGIALVPSEACLIKMLYVSGFARVYKLATPPDHDDYVETPSHEIRRTMLAASRFQLHSDLYESVPDPRLEDLWQKRPQRTPVRDAILHHRSRGLVVTRIGLTLSPLIPNTVHGFLQGLRRKMSSLPAPNLSGDRDIEWSWTASHIPSGPGEALDFGPGKSNLAIMVAERGFNVTAVDLEPVHWPYVHPRLRFLRGDILRLSLPKEHFNLVINCSTVEHVGLAGRYGITQNRPEGDLEAMARLRDLMISGGTMLMTVPVGQDAVFSPLCRVYGARRLPRLLSGYLVRDEVFWLKDSKNRWVLSEKEAALSFEASAESWDPLQNSYGLGCFVLTRP